METRKVRRARVLRFRRRWARALLSGRWHQCRSGALREHSPGTSDSFCCLGVAADLLRPGGWSSPGVNALSLEHELRGPGTQMLAEQVGLRKLGLSFADQRALADVNDEGVGFDLIAWLVLHLPVELG